MNPTQREAGAMAVLGVLAVAGLTLGGWWARWAWSRFGPSRFVVEGPSMTPTLCAGDRLLVRPVRRRAAGLRAGDIVAVRDPRDARRVLIKRVLVVTETGVDVRGDNPGASTDSRAFGPVAVDAVIGRAVYRYGPPGRAGLLAPRARAES